MENKQLEDSASSDGWNSFKGQVVSCIRRAHEKAGPFLFQEETMKNRNYHDMLYSFAVLKMARLQPNVSFQQDGASSHWGLTVRESLNKTFQTDGLGVTGQFLAPSLLRYSPIGLFLFGLCKGADIPSKRWWSG
jgi:hypothetical protein